SASTCAWDLVRTEALGLSFGAEFDHDGAGRPVNPRQRRAVLLLVVAAAGLLGVFALVANYVSDVDTQVGPKVSVLVLSKDAKKNQAITDDMVVEKLIPRRWAPKSALDRSQLVGFVAGSDL